MATCIHTGIWCLTYIDDPGMFCAICWMKKVSQPKKWFQGLDLEPNVRYQTETMQGHLVCTSDHKTMHGDGVETEKL